MFDRNSSILTVTTPTFSAAHRVHDGARLRSTYKRDILPLLALQVSRRRARSQ
ncbi:MAG TPA: hypothetical protein VFG38_09880 [Pseudomonadales bacterium]|nr:hypothetical protein [Pseudomonadales bacterium]